MKSTIALGITGLGLFLLVLSFVWVSMFSGQSAFTKEKSDRWSEVKNRLHNLAFIVNAPPGTIKMHSGPDIGQAKAEYDQLKIENAQLAAEFSGVYDTPRTLATVLKWSGLSLAIVGLIGWYAVSQSR
jgi:hypothetical protein